MRTFKDLAKEIREKGFEPLPENVLHDTGFEDFLHDPEQLKKMSLEKKEKTTNK